MSIVDVFSLSFAVKDLAVCAFSAAIADDRAWPLSHKVKFYDCKTEFIVIGTRQHLFKVGISSVKAASFNIVL